MTLIEICRRIAGRARPRSDAADPPLERPCADPPLERPWMKRGGWPSFRLAGQGFSGRDYRTARRRAEEVARLTLGEEQWTLLRRQRHLDVPSGQFSGVSYRLRVGRRIEVRCAAGVEAPWPYRYLCVMPAYPLPEIEFFAHLYLYLRDQEEEVLRVAQPQKWDQALGRTF